MSIDAFQAFAKKHQRKITPLVMPMMLLELIASLWLFQLDMPWAEYKLEIAWLGLALMALIWLSTIFWQVPIHHSLAKVDDEKSIPGLVQRLVLTNWVRTASWSLRSLLAIGLML